MIVYESRGFHTFVVEIAAAEVVAKAVVVGAGLLAAVVFKVVTVVCAVVEVVFTLYVGVCALDVVVVVAWYLLAT